jgi:SAM-dependent methyltransferase
LDHLTRFYPESRFGGFSNIDGTIAFYARVNALLRPGDTLVDIGCGRGAYGQDPVEYRRQLRILKGKCEKVIGIDVDRSASRNPFIDEFRPIEGDTWPIDTESVDICLSDNVLEHVENPQCFFKECARALNPGGYLCIRTPNLLSYIGLITKIIPSRGHRALLTSIKKNLRQEDIFPTLYRCNTIRSLRRALDEAGFEHTVYGYEAEPSYLSFNRMAYFLGVLSQRFTPAMFKVGIHAFARKGSRQER